MRHGAADRAGAGRRRRSFERPRPGDGRVVRPSSVAPLRRLRGRDRCRAACARCRAPPAASHCQRAAERAGSRFLDSRSWQDAGHRRGRVHRLARRPRARRARRRAAPDDARLDEGRRTSPASSTRPSSATSSTAARCGARCSDVDRVFHCAGMTSLRAVGRGAALRGERRSARATCSRSACAPASSASSTPRASPRSARAEPAAAPTRTSSSPPASSGSRTSTRSTRPRSRRSGWPRRACRSCA